MPSARKPGISKGRRRPNFSNVVSISSGSSDRVAAMPALRLITRQGRQALLRSSSNCSFSDVASITSSMKPTGCSRTRSLPSRKFTTPIPACDRCRIAKKVRNRPSHASTSSRITAGSLTSCFRLSAANVRRIATWPSRQWTRSAERWGGNYPSAAPMTRYCRAPGVSMMRERRLPPSAVCRTLVSIGWVNANQVVSNDIVRKRYKISIFTIAAFDFWFLAYGLDPLITADRLVTAFTGALAFKASWVDIFPTSEQRPKKSNLLFLGRFICYV